MRSSAESRDDADHANKKKNLLESVSLACLLNILSSLFVSTTQLVPVLVSTRGMLYCCCCCDCLVHAVGSFSLSVEKKEQDALHPTSHRSHRAHNEPSQSPATRGTGRIDTVPLPGPHNGLDNHKRHTVVMMMMRHSCPCPSRHDALGPQQTDQCKYN